MIRNIVFDMGNVMIRFDPLYFMDREEITDPEDRKLVLNELYGAADADADKFIELYNNGDDPIKLKDVVIKKDEEETWKGLEGEVIMGHSFFTIVGAKGTTPRGFSSCFSIKKSFLVEIYDPNNKLVDWFQRGEK